MARGDPPHIQVQNGVLGAWQVAMWVLREGRERRVAGQSHPHPGPPERPGLSPEHTLCLGFPIWRGWIPGSILGSVGTSCPASRVVGMGWPCSSLSPLHSEGRTGACWEGEGDTHRPTRPDGRNHSGSPSMDVSQLTPVFTWGVCSVPGDRARHIPPWHLTVLSCPDPDGNAWGRRGYKECSRLF